ALEPLVSGIAMRLVAAEVGHDGELAIVTLGAKNASQGAHDRASTICADDEARRKRAAIAQHDLSLVGVEFQALRLALQRRLLVAPERVLQRGVLDDPGELGQARAIGIELEARST